MWVFVIGLLAAALAMGAGRFETLLLAVAVILLAARVSGLDERLKALQPPRAPRQEPTTSEPEPIPLPASFGTPEPPTPALVRAIGRPAAGSTPPPAPPAARSTWKMPELANLEQLVAGRGLAIAGGAALIMGAIFFLGLAFSRGWIGPELRVVIGLVVGTTLFGLGAWLLRRDQPIVAHVVVAVGLGVLSLALFAATRLYELVNPELGVAGALAASAAAAVLAIRANAPLIAGFGLIAVLASPPAMGASANLTTLLFLGAALIGTTAIALYRTWTWLPSLAFLLAAPQLASFLLGEPALVLALSSIAAFWALNAVAAAGEEMRVPQRLLRPTSATLLLASAAFAVWAGFAALDGQLEEWRGLFLLVLALAHGGIGAMFLLRGGLQHPFGMLAAGTGVAVLTLAVPVQLGSPWVPLAWVAEAVALTWVYRSHRHIHAGLGAAVLGTLAAGHLLLIEYPIDLLVVASPSTYPFINSNGAALGFVLLGLGVAAGLLRERSLRMTLAGVAGALVMAAGAHELARIPYAVVLVAIGIVAVLVERRLLNLRLLDRRLVNPAVSLQYSALVGERALYLPALLAGLNLLVMIPAALLPVRDLYHGMLDTLARPSPPFANEATVVVAVAAAGSLVVAAAGSGRLWREAGLLVAAALISYLLPTQVSAAWSVTGWVAIALALHAAGARLGLRMTPVAAMWVMAVATAESLLVVAPPSRLVVQGTALSEPMLLNGGMLAIAAITLALVARAFLPPRGREARVAAIGAGVAALYLASIGTVDVFQAQLGGPTALEELQKQAQVALSVLWAVLGVGALVVGLVRNVAQVRVAGLVLLSVVTVKVFVADLAALDVAYRVLSFVALGVLLLGAAYLYRRLQRPVTMQQATRPPR